MMPLAWVMPLAFLDILTSGGQMLVAMLGIAFLIFIHEGGHFLAAKYCGVKVEVFSLGFGQRLWGFEHGGTDYRVSLLPLGGYVQMLGQDDTDPSQPKTDREDDFRNKSVAQRALILVGGVAVNALFAVFAFIVAFWVGVPFPSPEVGYTNRGGPAEGQLKSGDQILSIDGQEIIAFQDVQQIVAFSGGQPMNFKVSRLVNNERKQLDVKITARKGEDDELYTIGVGGLYVVAQVEDKSKTSEQDLKKGDRILSFKNKAGKDRPMSGISELTQLAYDNPGSWIPVTVERPKFDSLGNPIAVEKTFDAKIYCPELKHWTLGLEYEDTPRVSTILAQASAEKGGLQKDDQILSIGGQAAVAPTLGELVQVACKQALAAKQTHIEMAVRRLVEGKSQELTLKIPVPEPKGADKRFTLGFGFGADMVKSIVPGSPLDEVNKALKKDDPEAVVLQAGDRLTRIQIHRRLGMFWVGNEPAFRRNVQSIVDIIKDSRPARLSFEREGRSYTVVVTPKENADDRYGSLELAFRQRRIMVQRGFFDGLKLGLYSTRVSMGQILQMLRSLVVRRDVSVKKLGGPIKIVQIATVVADHGPGKMIWFLALLSVNLAVLNILPIPVLDGGHLLFIMIEWLKGEPVSEDVLIYAQWAGLILILGLIITVTFNDIISLWTSV